MYEMNLKIAQNYFDTLILDYEFTESIGGFIPHVSCRVLRDGNYLTRFTATDRKQAIEKFMSGEYKKN